MNADSEQELLFIRSTALRRVLVERCQELRRIRDQDLSLSQVFLAGSIVEGIMRELARIHCAKIIATATFGERLAAAKGNKEKTIKPSQLLRRLTIENVGRCLEEANVLDMKKLDTVYVFLRNHRNCIHPTYQAKENLSITYGRAKIALGVFDTTMEELEKLRFYNDGVRLRAMTGLPDLDENGTVTLPMYATEPLHTNSFLLLDVPVRNKLCFKGHISMEHGGIVNFVFNYSNGSTFKFIRLDSRGGVNCPNGLVTYDGGRGWRVFARAIPEEFRPVGRPVPVELLIDVETRLLSFSADSIRHSYLLPQGQMDNLFDIFQAGTHVGFFNELSPVQLKIETLEVT